MTYAELKAQFTAILNRTDITDALSATFMNMGMQRFQRDLRTPLQEVSQDTIVGLTFNGLLVPTDLIEMISIQVDGYFVSYLPYTRFVDITDKAVGQPVVWTRKGAKILLQP